MKTLIKTFFIITTSLIVSLGLSVVHTADDQMNYVKDIQDWYGIPEELHLTEADICVITLPTIEAGKVLGRYDWNKQVIFIDPSIIGTYQCTEVLAHELAHHYDNVVNHSHSTVNQDSLDYDSYVNLDVEAFANALASTFTPMISNR